MIRSYRSLAFETLYNPADKIDRQMTDKSRKIRLGLQITDDEGSSETKANTPLDVQKDETQRVSFTDCISDESVLNQLNKSVRADSQYNPFLLMAQKGSDFGQLDSAQNTVNQSMQVGEVEKNNLSFEVHLVQDKPSVETDE